MTDASASNIPKKLLRWSVEDALREFGHEVRADGTLRKKLRAAQQFPGPDGKYSTEQITLAIYSESTRERLRGTKERADNWGAAERHLRSESLPKAQIVDALESVFGIVKTLITASNMTSAEKRDLLATIGSWRAAVATAAQKSQSATQYEHS